MVGSLEDLEHPPPPAISLAPLGRVRNKHEKMEGKWHLLERSANNHCHVVPAAGARCSRFCMVTYQCSVTASRVHVLGLLFYPMLRTGDKEASMIYRIELAAP